MAAVLLTFEQPPCSCCGPEVEESEYPNLYEAMHAAEKRERKELDWQEVKESAEYHAPSRVWWRNYEALTKEEYEG